MDASGTENVFLRAITEALPTPLAEDLRKLCLQSPGSEALLDSIIRFVSGAPFSTNPSVNGESREQWVHGQSKCRQLLDGLLDAGTNGGKRQREEDPESQNSKRQKTSDWASQPDERPLFTLHSISITAPIRKKVDVTIYPSTIVATNPSTSSVEATLPVSSFRRAFILPTRGKQKPHWTVVILSSDVTERNAKAAKGDSGPAQLIFGLDAAAAAPLTTSDFSDAEKVTETIKKGGATLPAIRTFLSHLSSICPIQVYETSIKVFKSNTPSTSNPDGAAGLEGYLGAKQGTLWFFEDGLLWGEAKPCEFWSIEGLLSPKYGEGVRVVSATGRMCSVTLTRQRIKPGEAVSEDGQEDVEDYIGDETAIAMVDAREQEGIHKWVRQRRNLFGKDKDAQQAPPSPVKPKEKLVLSGPLTIHQLGNESDDSDEDFENDSDASGSGSASEGEGGEGADGDGDEDASGAEDGDLDAEGESDEDLDPKHHPLLRPGAMPRMSRAAVNMVVDMVEDGLTAGHDAHADEDEEDELAD